MIKSGKKLRQLDKKMTMAILLRFCSRWNLKLCRRVEFGGGFIKTKKQVEDKGMVNSCQEFLALQLK